MCGLNWGFTTVGLGIKTFTAELAALKVGSSKVVKHKKTCSDNQHVFIPFVFDTFDFLAPEVVDLLHRVQMSRISMSCLLSP